MKSKFVEKFHSRKIAARWATNVLPLILLVFISIFVAVSMLVKTTYYNGVESYLSKQVNSAVENYFDIYLEDYKTFSECADAFIDSYASDSNAAVWIIDSGGEVILSSSGFKVENEDISDYKKALMSEDGASMWTGKLSSGENVMAYTQVVSNINPTQSGAVRYIVSLENVNSQIYMILLLIFAIFVLLLAVVITLNLLFIRSITKPVKALSKTAEKIANGDFGDRIVKTNSDELGDLCDAINNMSESIATAEIMKNDFISTVSHELRTPLTSIKGWGETLITDPQADSQLTHRGLQVIINEAGRLGGFVEELLDFSRIENGKMSLRLEKIDILAELDETIFVFKERAMREGIEVQYTAPDVPAPALADADRIKQVFVNILDNAIKYNSEGGRVFVSAELEKDKILIIVADNGCGISKQDLPHVKEKFYKANISVKGSGIGLAVATEIVQLHGGALDIESVVNEGTTVTISIPLVSISDERNTPINE